MRNSKRKRQQAPTQQAPKTDGYAEAFTGMGTSRDRSAGVTIKAASLMQQQELTDLYIGDGIARRIVDAPAEEMTRAGFDFELLDETTEKSLKVALDNIDIQKHLNTALRWSRAFGGALVVMGVNDGGTLDVPLNPDGVKEVEFLRVYDRFEATIHKRNEDTYSVFYGLPEVWQITPAEGGNPYYVHRSRVEVFDGAPIPNRMRQQNQGWGASVLQQCLDQVVRLGASHQWANMLLERVQQAVHKIPNLTTTLKAPGGEALIQKRVDVVDMVRGVLNTIVIDGEEAYELHNQSMSGVNELLDRFAQLVSAVSEIPMFILMGQGKGGLNNTNAGELEAWYGKVGSWQNNQLRKPICRIADLILTSMDKKGAEYQLKFNPLYVPSDKEQAETNSANAQAESNRANAAVAYVNAGIIDVSEVRSKLAESDVYNIDLSLEPVAPEAEEADNKSKEENE